MEWKSRPTTYRLWLHLWQLADKAVVYDGIIKGWHILKKLRALENCRLLMRCIFYPHKNIQQCCHQTRFLGSKYTETVCGKGSAPDPARGAYIAPQT